MRASCIFLALGLMVATATTGNAQGGPAAQPQGVVTKRIPSPPSSLPPTIIGLPRTNPLDGSEYQGGFVLTDSDYLGSLVGQGMAGFALAIILLASMVLMIVVWIISTFFGLMCKCCNGAYKPRNFSKRDLLINKGVMFGFCLITACGCFVVFAETGPLLEGTKDLTGGMADTITDLSTLVTSIADTLDVASQDPALGGVGNVASSTGEMKTAAASVDQVVQNAQKDIEAAIDQGGGYTLIAAGVMFGVSFIIFAAALIGFWRLLILLMVILSVFLILGWIAWGVLSITSVFVDDLCTAMKGYLNDRYSSDLKDLIPCLNPKAAVDVMNQARDMVATGVTKINDDLKNFTGTNPNPKYLCLNYVKMDMKDLCSETVPTAYYKQDYTKFTCEAYHQGNLPGVNDAFPDAFCPYPDSYYNVSVGDFGNDLKHLRCNSTSDNMVGLAQCYATNQIPADIFDKAAMTASLAQSIIDIIPGIEDLLQCKLVENAFNRMVGPCDDMAAALASLWAGFLLVAMGYFLIWVSAIVIITRLHHYKEKCTDADNTNKV